MRFNWNVNGLNWTSIKLDLQCTSLCCEITFVVLMQIICIKVRSHTGQQHVFMNTAVSLRAQTQS